MIDSSSSIDFGSCPNAKSYSLFSSLSQTTSIKLDRANFLVWESIVLPLIEGNQLEGHIDDTLSALPNLIIYTVGNRANLAYSKWFSVDRMLVGWLRNTRTQDVSAQLLHCQTAEELWNGARDLTCASTKARVMVVKNELHNTWKNALKMEEYLNKMKNLDDELALDGYPIAMDDLILHTLNGLDAEYNAIIIKLVDKFDLT